MIGYGKGKLFRFLTNTIRKVTLSQYVTFDEFHAPPKEVLHGNVPFIVFELEKLEIHFLGED